MTTYSIACIQSVIRHVSDPDSARAVIRENVNRIIANIEYTVRRQGRPRLVVLPEFALTGFDPERTIEDWVKICPQLPGEETQLLGQVAAQYNLYIACGTMEYDPDWPGRWFNSAFIVGPSGDVILKYRLHYAANVGGVGNCTSIGDVYSEYVRRYGTDGIFPVVETEIGKLGIVMGNDMGHPEIARALALKGAEVIIRPSSGFWGGAEDVQEHVRRARAFENMAYFATAGHGVYLSRLNDGRYVDDGYPLFAERQTEDIIPTGRGKGPTGVWHFDGHCLGMIDTHGEATITATVDLDELRAWRREPHALNFLGRLRTGLFPAMYEQTRSFPMDHWLASPIQKRAEGLEVSKGAVQTLLDTGVIQPPPPRREIYTAAVIQTALHAIPSREERDATVARNRDRSMQLIEAQANSGAKLIVLPEFYMQGTPNPSTKPVWPSLCFTVPGPDLQPLQDLAARTHVYIALGIWERDQQHEERWYNTAVLIGPEGEIALKYSGNHPASQRSPLGDFSIVDHLPEDFDWRELFPVADTPLGKIGLTIGYEICLPEVARALTLNGAEIICHVTGELQSEFEDSWQSARRARAVENNVYLLSANAGESIGGRLARFQFSGHSAIIDYNGRTQAEIKGLGESIVSARIDITGLRKRRMQPRSYLAQMRPYLYPDVYRSVPGYPIHLPEGQAPAQVAPGTYLRQTLEEYQARGIIAPES